LCVVETNICEIGIMRIAYDSCVRAILLILQGYSIACVGIRTMIPERTLRRVWLNFRTYGTVHKPKGELRVRKLSPDDLAWLRLYLSVNSSLYIDEIQSAIWFHRNKNVSASTVLRAIKEFGWTRKKAFPLAKEASPQQQADFISRMQQYSAEQLVFIDEVRTDKRTYTRKYAWSPPGIRPRGFGHFVRGTRYSTVAAMCSVGVLAHFTIENSFTSECLCVFARDYLIPRMNPYPQPRSVVVLDNASTHHAPEFVAMLRQAGLRVEFLPPYTPQFNPIEELFGTLKTLVRRLGTNCAPHMTDMLILYRAFGMISDMSCRAWIRRAGYVVRQ